MSLDKESSIFCDETTATAARKDFVFESVGLMEIKGSNRPVDVYTPTTTQNMSLLLRLGEQPMVGREKEEAIIRQLFARKTKSNTRKAEAHTKTTQQLEISNDVTEDRDFVLPSISELQPEMSKSDEKLQVHLVAVEGSFGVGKSRILLEIQQQALLFAPPFPQPTQNPRKERVVSHESVLCIEASSQVMHSSIFQLWSEIISVLIHLTPQAVFLLQKKNKSEQNGSSTEKNGGLRVKKPQSSKVSLNAMRLQYMLQSNVTLQLSNAKSSLDDQSKRKRTFNLEKNEETNREIVTESTDLKDGDEEAANLEHVPLFSTPLYTLLLQKYPHLSNYLQKCADILSIQLPNMPASFSTGSAEQHTAKTTIFPKLSTSIQASSEIQESAHSSTPTRRDQLSTVKRTEFIEQKSGKQQVRMSENANSPNSVKDNPVNNRSTSFVYNHRPSVFQRLFVKSNRSTNSVKSTGNSDDRFQPLNLRRSKSVLHTKERKSLFQKFGRSTIVSPAEYSQVKVLNDSHILKNRESTEAQDDQNIDQTSNIPNDNPLPIAAPSIDDQIDLVATIAAALLLTLLDSLSNV